MTISIKINNGQPIPLMWYLFILLFFFRILAILALENIAKILTTGPRSDLPKTLLARVLWCGHLHVDTAGTQWEFAHLCLKLIRIWPKALWCIFLPALNFCIIFFNLKRRRWSDLFIKLNVLYLGPVTFSYIGNWSDPVRVFTDVSWFFFEKMYRLDPDKNRASTRRTVSVRRFFWAPKAYVKMMDKIFTILCWIFSLLSRPRNRMEILGNTILLKIIEGPMLSIITLMHFV